MLLAGLFLIGQGCPQGEQAVINSLGDPETPPAATETGNAPTPTQDTTANTNAPTANGPAASETAVSVPAGPTYTGTRLAGSEATPLLDFTQADFEAALASGDLIVLYFYANWCPICKAEQPALLGAFDELQGDGVVGFRVNFNDNETDDDEVALAREHGVAYQHTKVFVRNGERLLKSPESWNQDRYRSEISNARGQ
jgi:thiol-disulfide isomerase/thioredoxin